ATCAGSASAVSPTASSRRCRSTGRVNELAAPFPRGGAEDHVMMRWMHALALGLLAASPLVAVARTHPLSGSWTASIDDDHAEMLDFSMRTSRHENNGTRFPIADFTGLTPALVRSASAVNAHFELRREAGTIAYDGSFRNGEGAGTFTFA